MSKTSYDGTPSLEEYKKHLSEDQWYNAYVKKPLKSTSVDTHYKYNEDKYLKELYHYVEATYGEHYSKNQFQATEFIIDGGHGDGFCIGNIMKYAQRYGNKDGYNRKDILKVLHYALIQLHVHDHSGRD